MRTTTILIALTMLTTGLAGCTGDPDGGGNDEIDAETLQNLQDFFNNSSVGSDSVMNMFTISWDREDSLLGFNPQTDLIELGNYTNQFSAQDPTLLYADYYNGQVIEFRFSCLEYLHYVEYSASSWHNWLEDNYGSNSNSNNNNNSSNNSNSSEGDNSYNVGQDIHWWLNYGIDDDVDEICHFDGYSEPTSRVVLFEIDLDVGEAMSIQVLPSYLEVDLNCDDGYGTGLGNGTSTFYIGGQANCTVTGSTSGNWRITNNGWLYDENGTRVEEYNENFRNWYVQYSSIAPENFAVYFTMHHVEVYDLDSE